MVATGGYKNLGFNSHHQPKQPAKGYPKLGRVPWASGCDVNRCQVEEVMPSGFRRTRLNKPRRIRARPIYCFFSGATLFVRGTTWLQASTSGINCLKHMFVHVGFDSKHACSAAPHAFNLFAVLPKVNRTATSRLFYVPKELITFTRNAFNGGASNPFNSSNEKHDALCSPKGAQHRDQLHGIPQHISHRLNQITGFCTLVEFPWLFAPNSPRNVTRETRTSQQKASDNMATEIPRSVGGRQRAACVTQRSLFWGWGPSK